MKFYGNLNLGENELQGSVIQLETSTPATTKAGRLLFRNKRMFIAAEIVTGLPVWVPLTEEIDTYVHRQTSSASSWVVNHNLGSLTPSIAVWDSNNNIIIPNEVTINDSNTITVSLGTAATGRVIVLDGYTGGEINALLGDNTTIFLMNTDSTNGSTTFTDELGKTITANGDAQHSTTQAKFGATSARFDGAGDYLQVADSTDFDLGISGEPFSMEMWINWSAVGTATLFGRGGGFGGWNGSNGHQLTFFYFSGNLYSQWWNGSTYSQAFAPWSPATGQWYHLALSYDGSNLRSFIDGSVFWTFATPTFVKPTASTITRFGGAVSNENFFNGYIDSIRIDKNFARYTAPFTPPTSPFSL